MLNALKKYLDGRSSAQVIAFGLVLVASVGTLDHLTGYEFSFSIFYLLPIAIVAWYTQKWVGFFFCGLVYAEMGGLFLLWPFRNDLAVC